MRLALLLSLVFILFISVVFGVTYSVYFGADDYYYDDTAYFDDFSDEEFDVYEAEIVGNFSEEEPAEYAAAMEQNYSQEPARYATQSNSMPSNSKTISNGKVSMRPLVDSKTGRTTAYAPLPSNWKIGKHWESPNGSRVELRQGGTASAQQRPIQSIDQLIQQTLLPDIKRTGAQIDRIIDLPGIARNNHRNHSQYWTVAPAQVTHQVKGIEMTHPSNGQKGILIVNLILSRSQYFSSNTHYSNLMHAEERHYEKDKKALIYALENLQLDRQAVAAHNQREQQKSQASWASHNQRMAQNQANFNSWQKTQSTLSEVNDIYYNGWKSRNQMKDAGHQKSINGIWEQQTSVNPYSGQQMTTSTNYKYHYMNQNGQVFGTNNPNYNPALDPNMNQQEWKKVQSPGGY